MFNHDIFVKVYNNDLANNYGNMISRVWGLLEKFTNCQVPGLIWQCLTKDDKEVIKCHQELLDNYQKLIDDFKIKDLLAQIQVCYDVLNKYIETAKPWALFKNNQKDNLNNCLNIIFHFLVDLNILLSPVLVKTSQKFFDTFKLTNGNNNDNYVAFGKYYFCTNEKQRYEKYKGHNFKPSNKDNKQIEIIFARK